MSTKICPVFSAFFMSVYSAFCFISNPHSIQQWSSKELKPADSGNGLVQLIFFLPRRSCVIVTLSISLNVHVCSAQYVYMCAIANNQSPMQSNDPLLVAGRRDISLLSLSILLLQPGSMGDASKAYAHSFLMHWASKVIVSLECPLTALSINV